MKMMNERIKELAEQAYGIDDNKPFHPSALIALEKFAELIVRECADICCNVDDKHGEDDSIAYWAAKEILEHFGLIDDY